MTLFYETRAEAYATLSILLLATAFGFTFGLAAACVVAALGCLSLAIANIP